MTNTRKHYDRLIAEDNDPVNDPPFLQSYMEKWDGREFLSLLALTGGENVLEIGVGTGRLALQTVPRCRFFCGVDLSAPTLARAAEHLRGIGKVQLYCGDFLTLPFSRQFDVIYASLVFFHIRRKQAALFKAAKLLVPGGRIVLSLDKGTDRFLDYGTRKVRLYPDAPDKTIVRLERAGLCVSARAETDFAWQIRADKPS